jgi:hypothetical protein
VNQTLGRIIKADINIWSVMKGANMPTQNATRSPEFEKLDQLIFLSQQLFILQALQAGLNTDAVRSLLKIDYLRVIEISKFLQQAQKKQRKAVIEKP